MSVEKELPFLFSHPGQKVRSKQLKEPRGRNKARILRAHRKPRGDQRKSLPKSHCKKEQVREKEKVWVPWNGLIVIGKRVELLDRNVQKSNPKLESEDWKLEGTGRKFSKEKSGLQQETVVAKLLSSVRRTVQARAGLENDSPEIWRELEDRLKADVTTSAEITAERGENLKSRDRLRTPGGDLRSRGDQLRPNEELESSGENLKIRVPIGDKVAHVYPRPSFEDSSVPKTCTPDLRHRPSPDTLPHLHLGSHITERPFLRPSSEAKKHDDKRNIILWKASQ
ncbi:uncharacterized protein LOC110338654 [Mus pahari]|uniref:uncharacterized protein LOC110338654 n=1 Tax=Mus pahari TaxID=10093 RepID=UPI001114E84B|nr:uncharacterized protein LOC110338654 [Mus pahari]